ncbi:hypothetical protein F4083_11415 [Candidatus Poribacteria bacterium]|nr:hypothetical protein [Candidatus Poribacteria bacterium]MYF56981.1 hypothetical protein [Candidatus Poribacteria bacterium]MYI94903.1 hypothetical protein [Candidatus Poribacteria bacterium]
MMTIDELSRSLKDGFEAINKRLDGIDTRLDGIDTRLRSVETDVAWIKGKFEGRQEGRANIWQLVTTATAVGAAVIALIALFLK